MESKTILFGAGVFVALFVGVLFLPMDRLLKPSQPFVVVGPLTTRVEGTFQKVKDDHRTEAQRQADADAREIEETVVFAKIDGHKPLPPEQIKAAQNDAPRVGYYAYGKLDRSKVRLPMLREANIATMKVGCFSWREDNYVRHMMFLYNDTKMVRDEGTGLMDWIYSGCAEAVHGGRQLNQVQFTTTLRSLLPPTREYDQQRRDMLAQLNQKPEA